MTPGRVAASAAFMAALGLTLGFVLGPFAWQVVTALKPAAQLGQLPPLLPAPPTWAHFAAVLTAEGFARVTLNSLVVAVGAVAAALTLGVPAAYALARLRPAGSPVVLATMLCLTMFPAVANVGPLYLMFIALGIRDSLAAVMLSHIVFSLPFAIWTLSGFLRDLPEEIFRAARIDGCSHLGLLRHVVLPLAAPGLASVGLLVFVFSWNEFLYAFTLTASETSRTLPVAIALFSGVQEIPWGEIAAAAVLATLPTVVLMLVFQRYIASGLTAGAVKG